MDPTYVINCLETGNIDLLDTEPESMCRTCTAPATNEFRDIFESTGVLRKESSVGIYKIFEIVEILTGKPVAATDGLPQSICRACVKQFYTTFNFLNQVERVDVAFRKYANCSMDGQPEEHEPIKEEFIVEEPERDEQIVVYPDVMDVPSEVVAQEEVHTTGDSSVAPGTSPRIKKEVTPRAGKRTAAATEKGKKKKAPSKAQEKRNAKKRALENVPPSPADVKNISKDSSPKKFQCIECDKSYSLVQALNRHRKAAHPQEKDNKLCPHCDRTFTRADSLARHIRNHTNERPYTCETCGKGFKQKSELNEHILTHTKAISYMCKICGKEYATRMGIFYHTKKHDEADRTIDPRIVIKKELI